MDAVQETVASAFVAYARLVKLGKEELAYATPLAQFAVRRVARAAPSVARLMLTTSRPPGASTAGAFALRACTSRMDGQAGGRWWSRIDMPRRPT